MRIHQHSLFRAWQGGIKAIDTSPTNSSVVATAGGDGVVAVYDSSAGRLLAELRGHSKKVNGECSTPCCSFAV